MKICLTCRRASPARATCCTGCGRMLGARMCPEGHLNPVEAQFCQHCGSEELTSGTLCLSLAALPALLTLICGMVGGWVLLKLGLGTRLQAWGHRLLGDVCCLWYGVLGNIVVLSLVYLLLPEAWQRRVVALINLWMRLADCLFKAVLSLISLVLSHRRKP